MKIRDYKTARERVENALREEGYVLTLQVRSAGERGTFHGNRCSFWDNGTPWNVTVCTRHGYIRVFGKSREWLRAVAQ